MSSTTSDCLRDTVIGNWIRRLSANTSVKRNHWRTKTVYYRSVVELLAAHPGEPPTWRSIVATARPHGCRSTFYEVTGEHARHRMVDELIDDGGINSIQLALHYLRSDAVIQLVDEAKVWSYWPYREGLRARLLADPPPTETAREDALIRTLLAWASQHPELAAAVDYTPPAGAVEDLMVLMDGQVPALRVASMLTDLVRDCARSSAGHRARKQGDGSAWPTASSLPTCLPT